MFIATFVSSDSRVRNTIERNALNLAEQFGVNFVCAVDEGYRPSRPYIARASYDLQRQQGLLLVLENIAMRSC